MSLTIEPASALSPEAGALLRQLDAALSAGYEPDQQHGLSVDELEEAHVHFFLVRLGPKAVGCGAVALFDGYAEIKRMFASPEARRSGIGKALITRFEEVARRNGQSRLCLETGIYQDEAIGFYERLGFARCGAFGPYLGKPPHTIAKSLFFQKPL